MAQVRRLASIVQNEDDDYMTPAFALQDLFSYIRENAEGLTVWEPFFGDGGSTRKIRELGYNVIGCEGKDFYVAPPPEGENIILVTNPPFSDKRKIMECIINKYKVKKFAVLLPTQILFSQYFRKMIEPIHVDILLPKARIQFLRRGDAMTERCPLDTAWFIRGLDLSNSRLDVNFHHLPQVGDRKCW